MDVQELKKELGLSNKDIAQFFNMTYGAFANSSAKERYENALCKFYSFLEGWRKEKNQDTTKVNISTFVCELNTCYEKCDIMQPAADCRLCDNLICNR